VEYLTPNNVAEMTPRRSDCASRLLTATRLYLSSPPNAPKKWRQINPNLNDYHSDQVEIRITFWIPDMTDWWRQQAATQSNYTDLKCGTPHIFHHTRWCRSGGQVFPCPRCYCLEAVENHRSDPSRKCCCKEVRLSQQPDFGRY